MPTNFDLAPPSKTVDGLHAVPIDIQHIGASLAFDGASSSGAGDATLDFIAGPEDGCPIFDLRQTVTAAWLDGASLPVAQVAHHDFGGGVDAQLRVVETVIAAGSSHTLRVSYTLGPPQASIAGSYQPAMTWSAGPRLVFNLGFTDLGAGRYLEAWIPANLIFDEFALDLELQMTNTAIAHAVITNGAVTSVGANHWTIAFPARFTALSPLLELRAADTLTSATDSVTLPVSGTTVTIEAWKLRTSTTIDLAVQIANLKTWLVANEQSVGPYLHGSRFVAFLNVGGMEYEGGTTSAPGSLLHETFHSWWGRGAKPASQPDGWLDEAWNVYNNLGGTGSVPFDFASPPIELSTRNPWSRITPSGAYSAGERFCEGAASLIGVASLQGHMSAFYEQHSARPYTTADVEAFLVSRSGESQLVDAFHRFVYGFPDPAPAPDLWLKDDPGDPGGNLWAGRFWDSPDLWIRNADDGGTTHQPVEHGQDNWFYARVRNRSASATARHFLVTFNVKPWAGVEFVYPGDFLPCIAAVADFDLGPGDSAVVNARWPAALIPPVGTHACWLAAVLTRSDPPASGRHVWEHNNLAQKNLAVVDLVPGDVFVLPFVFNRLYLKRPFTLELVRPPGWDELEVAVLHQRPDVFRRLPGTRQPAPTKTLAPALETRPAAPELDCGGAVVPTALAPEPFAAAFDVPFEAGRRAAIGLDSTLPGQLLMGLRIRVPERAKAGEVLRLDLVQRDEGRERVTGGLAIEVHVLVSNKAV